MYPPERTESARYGRGSVGIIMFTVYILKDKKGKLYKGLTNNLSRRLKEHKAGGTITTSRMTDVKVVHAEEYDTFVEARKRELYFKSAAGRVFIKKLPL